MTDQLHTSALVLGIVIGIQPLVELLLMPVAARQADRFDPLLVLTLGTIFGVAACVTFAIGGSATAMFVGQVLNAVMWACLAALGVSIAQQLYPDAVATASGLYSGGLTLAWAVGGAVGAVGVAMLGLPGVFYVPAAFIVLAVVGLFLMWRQPSVRARLSTP
jgi:MFS transporter, SET family, sugar efflux transporter